MGFTLNRDSRIMITGGLGFIGSNLVRQLVKNDCQNISVLSRSDKKIANLSDLSENFDLIVDDVKNIAQHIKDCDVIIHLASTTDNYAIQDDEPHRDSDVNVLTTSYLLDAIRTVNPEVRLVFGSTFFAVGNPDKCPVDETVCCRPTGLYGATRLCGEHLTVAYRNAFNLNATVVRFTNVYGPYERSAGPRKAAFNYFIIKALRDEAITMYGDGSIRRDYIYVDDAVKGILAVAEKGDEDLYFIGSGKPRSLKEIFETIIQVVGKGSIQPVETPKFHKKVGTMDFWVDNGKISNLGWKPDTSLEEGIGKTVEYYENQPKLMEG